ncbi:unnamed protein product [Haemonchus placei]|uniref:Anaphase-promoting complex subunit 5 n=1 Tax=Haemonchus placei TaxID=6290 RepID=A0A0N4WNX1_HAEPC|nr:unnamed protein product [Haemonchus placei]
MPSLRLGTVDVAWEYSINDLFVFRACFKRDYAEYFATSRQAARLLLNECVQQAQNHDVVCLRMAVVELAALEAVLPNDVELKTLTEEKSTETLLTTDELLRMIDRVADTEPRIEGDDHRDAVASTDESEQLFEQLNALAHLMTAITAARRCPDVEARARLISDAAVATTCSVRLRHGLALSTQSLATSLVETNYSDGCAPRHETEAHAIAGVNMVYAAAMMGEWDRVTTMLSRLKLYFTPELNWQAAQYVNLCDWIILFDAAILRGQWDKCIPVLEDIETLDPAEAALRLQLQLAMFLSAEYRWSAAIEMLQGVREEAIGVEQRNIAAMALRRIGVVQLMSGGYETALKSLTECQKDITDSCSILERAVLSIALAQAYSLTGNRNEQLQYLTKARAQCRQAGAILFEKFVLTEIVFFYHERGDMDERDDIASEFAAIDDRYGGHFDWKLV